MTSPPVNLVGAALDEWNRITTDRAWTPSQLASLAGYCAAYGRWSDAETWLADPAHGPVLTIHDDKGNIKSHGAAPQLLIAERSLKEMGRLARLLRLR